MDRRIVAYVVAGVIAVGLIAAVVIRTTGSGSATETTTIPSTVPPTTVPPTTIPPTTIPPTEPPTTIPPPTEPPTTVPPTAPPTTLPPPDRASVPVVVTSAGQTGERVGPAVYLLGAGGWKNIRGVNGAVATPATIVYFADGFQSSAELLATDLSLPVTSIAPLASAPPVAGLGDAVLLVYIGGV